MPRRSQPGSASSTIEVPGQHPSAHSPRLRDSAGTDHLGPVQGWGTGIADRPAMGEPMKGPAWIPCSFIPSMGFLQLKVTRNPWPCRGPGSVVTTRFRVAASHEPSCRQEPSKEPSPDPLKRICFWQRNGFSRAPRRGSRPQRQPQTVHHRKTGESTRVYAAFLQNAPSVCAIPGVSPRAGMRCPVGALRTLHLPRAFLRLHEAAAGSVRSEHRNVDTLTPIARPRESPTGPNVT